MFSWPISSPFGILHVNLWIPGDYLYTNSYMVLMNTVCDTNQFVIIIPVPNESSAILASYFMQHVWMKFGLCHLVVLYGSSIFKRTFIGMCQALNLYYNLLAKRNHMGITVEIFHRYLKKRFNNSIFHIGDHIRSLFERSFNVDSVN